MVKRRLGSRRESRAELLEIAWQRIEDEVCVGKDVIFDAGSWTRKNRDYNRARAKKLGVNYIYYSVDCTPEIAWQRVLKRNSEKICGEYPKDRFEEKLQLFQSMQEDEEFELIMCDDNN